MPFIYDTETRQFLRDPKNITAKFADDRQFPITTSFDASSSAATANGTISFNSRTDPFTLDTMTIYLEKSLLKSIMYYLWFEEVHFQEIILPFHQQLSAQSSFLKTSMIPKGVSSMVNWIFLGGKRNVYLQRHDVGKKFGFFQLPKEDPSATVTFHISNF